MHVNAQLGWGDNSDDTVLRVQDLKFYRGGLRLNRLPVCPDVKTVSKYV